MLDCRLQAVCVHLYRGTSLIRKHHPVGPYSTTMPRLLWRSEGGMLDGRLQVVCVHL